MAEDNQPITDTPVDPVAEATGEGEGNVDASALTLDQLNTQLKTQYKTMDEAVKGLVETKNYVGKAGTVEKELNALKENLGASDGEFITKDQYEQDLFYSKNSDLEPYKDIINARAKDLGVRPADAVNDDASLKQTLEKLRGFDSTENAKSVLMSNQRLGQVTDDMEKAQEAQQKGDMRGASDSAVKAVLSSFTKE